MLSIFGDKKYGIFEPKSWWKYDIYWLLKSSCFNLFGNGKYGLFWAKKLIEIWYLLITEKVLFSTFRWLAIRSFFESRSWWKYDISWLLKKSCFELFGDGKYGLFFSQEVDGKMIFTGYWEVLVLNFSVMGNTVFFHSKRGWKDDIYMVFLSFPWYSRAWEIWFFEQWSELEDSEIKGCSELSNFRKLLSKEEKLSAIISKVEYLLTLGLLCTFKSAKLSKTFNSCFQKWFIE